MSNLENKLYIEENIGSNKCNSKIYILSNDDKQIAFADLKLYFPNHKEISHYWVNYIFVEEEHRGKGYGSLLIKEINNFLDKKGIIGILSDQTKDNPINYKSKFYERHNWVNRNDCYYYPKPLDDDS